jgi:hypothetical protein
MSLLLETLLVLRWCNPMRLPDWVVPAESVWREEHCKAASFLSSFLCNTHSPQPQPLMHPLLKVSMHLKSEVRHLLTQAVNG